MLTIFKAFKVKPLTVNTQRIMEISPCWGNLLHFDQEEHQVVYFHKLCKFQDIFLPPLSYKSMTINKHTQEYTNKKKSLSVCTILIIMIQFPINTVKEPAAHSLKNSKNPEQIHVRPFHQYTCMTIGQW